MSDSLKSVTFITLVTIIVSDINAGVIIKSLVITVLRLRDSITNCGASVFELITKLVAVTPIPSA